MFSKILNSVVKSENSSSGSTEAPDAKSNANKIALVTKESDSSRQLSKRTHKTIDPDEKAPACD
jgi:hypothetical protein